jgi:hypothetical protein
MSVDERIETLDLSVDEYEGNHLGPNRGVSYAVAKPIRFSQRAKNWLNTRFDSNEIPRSPIETQDWIYQPDGPSKYAHATFQTKSEKPLRAHVTRSMGATPSPYQVNGTIVGATTWSIDPDSNIATAEDSYIFESGIDEASYRWKAPRESVRNKFEQSLERKLTPVTQKATRASYDASGQQSTNRAYQRQKQPNLPVSLSRLRIV